MRRHYRSESIGDIPENGVEKSDEPLKLEYPENKIKGKKRRNFIKEYLRDFTTNSNLHGLKYIGEKERTIVEKFFWLFMCVCCVVLCSGLIRKVWIKWNESPVIVSFAENPTPVWEIPYPAVSLCIETKARQRQYNFTEYYHLYNNDTARKLLTEEEKNRFEDLTMVCDDSLAPVIGRKYSSGKNTVSNLYELSPNITDVVFFCKWKDSVSSYCQGLFSPVLTEEGICYTFNILRAEELFRTENLQNDYPYLDHDKQSTHWSLENGYEKETLETYPHRGSGFGIKSGLTILLKANVLDLDYLCKGPVQGYKILLHNPAELPRLSQQFFRTPLAQEVVVAVKPTMMTTSEGLRSYDPIRRKCYFSTERYLKYFKVYTQANCDMECLSNFTYARCGCVHFGMPHSTNMTTCNAGSMVCIRKSQMALVSIEIQSGFKNAENNINDDILQDAREVHARCQCLPACTSIEYDAETSQADFDAEALFRGFKYDVEKYIANNTFSRVMIFFKEAQFITSRRSELYGQTDFLANCGGLLGLFMGFSILSVAEILYFLTLRLCCIFWRRRHSKNRGVDDIPNTNPDKLKKLSND